MVDLAYFNLKRPNLHSSESSQDHCQNNFYFIAKKDSASSNIRLGEVCASIIICAGFTFSFLVFLYFGDLSCLFSIFLSKLPHTPQPQITWAGTRGVQMQEANEHLLDTSPKKRFLTVWESEHKFPLVLKPPKAKKWLIWKQLTCC